VRDALSGVRHPRGADIVSLGLLSGLSIDGDMVRFAIEVEPDSAARMEPLRKAAEDAVRRIPGVRSVTAVLTSHRAAARERAGAPAAPARPAAVQRPGAKLEIPGVRSLVAVASGKGGVGKSTVAVNLALGLAANGRKTGLLDADIYGPSVPRMLALAGRPTTRDGKLIVPLERHGVRAMSMGLLVPEETPMIWRGPMVMGAIEQLLRDVAWGELDVLVIDLPPGTGDAQLTISQRAPLTGAVIVSTPQDIALQDARKGLNMFRRVDVPVIGIIENMSYFICPHCGERSEIFGHGGARREAERLGVEFLGEVALDSRIRETSDSGRPIVVSEPQGPHAATFRDIARRVWDKIEAVLEERARTAPRFVIE